MMIDWLNELIGDLRSSEVYFNLKGTDSHSIIKSFLSVAHGIPKEYDRNVLAKAFIEREMLMSTALDMGFAIPHIRNSNIVCLDTTFLSIGYLDAPVKWDNYDTTLVDTIFLFFSNDPERHLTILYGISRLISNQGFLELIRSRKDKNTLLEYLENISANAIDA